MEFLRYKDVHFLQDLGKIEERRLIYKNASHKIDCENLTKSEIVETIRKIYEI